MIHPNIFKTILLVLVSFSSNVGFGQDDPEQLEEAAVRAAVAKLEPSVVRFETIGGNSRVEGIVVASGPASGLVVSKDGYVISSSFHFAHQPASILARLPDGKKASAEIVGRDLSRKIVLLKIRSEFEFTTATTMKPDELQVGQTVIAVGRALDTETPNVSTGIVSAKNRVWNKAIQTDAKISPANFGGPLADLRGRVVGILVPMSPDADGEMAGTQWYDSGIGFAVPISDLMSRFEELKTGTPLRAGLLGISLKGSDIYVDKAIVAFCHGKSPAGKAGVESGDEIVEINRQKIGRQSELKHAIGSLYENDEAKLIVVRDAKRIPFTVRLAGEIEAYDPPGIGVTLAGGEDELIVNRVLEDSPAAQAGIEIGDRFETFNQNDIKNAEDIRSKLAASDVGDKVELEISRNGDAKRVKLTLTQQTADFFSEQSTTPTERDARLFEIKIADAGNHCFAIVPELLDGESPSALLVWISEPGKLNKEELRKTWTKHCSEQNVAILFPESADEKRWSPDEADFIVSAIGNLAKQSRFDTSRVTIGGAKTGGSMASLIAFGNRDIFQGLALLQSAPSSRISRLETSPVQPLLILVGTNEKEDESLQSSIKRFRDANFPVHLDRQTGGLPKWIAKLLQWSKTVNRL